MRPFGVPTCRAIAWLFFDFKKNSSAFYRQLDNGLNIFSVQIKHPQSKKVFGWCGGQLWVCSCRFAGVVGQVSVPVPGGIRRPGSRLSGLGVRSGSGARAPGVPVHINKLITCCIYCIVHKNEPILGVSFIILYNGLIACFVIILLF